MKRIDLGAALLTEVLAPMVASASDGMRRLYGSAVTEPGALAAPRSIAPRESLRGWSALGRDTAGVAALAALYYGAAKLGFELAFAGPVAAVVWLPVGVAVAFLALFGLRYWPGALIGDLLANNYAALPLGGALGQSFGNMVEVLLAAWLIRRLMRAGSPLERAPDVLRLLAAIAAGTLVSALVGPLSLLASGAVSAGSLPGVMRTWWLGDFCGALVVVPLALAWFRPTIFRLGGRQLVEASLLLAVTAVVSAVAAGKDDPLTYLVFPILALVVFRFGIRGGTLAVLVALTVTVWTTIHVNGPFHTHSFTRSVMSTQLLVVVAAISVLFFYAVISERRLLAERLGQSRERAVRAAEAERHRLERDLHDGAQQRLLALAMRLRLAAHRGTVPPESDALLLDAEQELQRAIEELRELSRGMHPSLLTRLGLNEAVRSIAARSTVPVSIVELPSFRVDEAAQTAAYFVVAEAMANAQKHADATAIRIGIRFRAPSLLLTISDDGRGGASERTGSGLAGLRDRVEALDGEFYVASFSGGTTISAAIPAAVR
jgi:signal transduction histidine kinase